VSYQFAFVVWAQLLPIINDGNDQTPAAHLPYLVSIRNRTLDATSFGYGHVCSGILIAPNAVLTLASCLNYFSASQVSIIGATQYRYTNESTVYRGTLSKIVVHSSYSSSTYANNIAIGYVR